MSLQSTRTPDDAEGWLTRQFDDAGAQVRLPPRDTWRPRSAHRVGGTLMRYATTIAGVAALAVLVVVAIEIAQAPAPGPSTVAATGSPVVRSAAPTVDVPTQMSTEAAWTSVRAAAPAPITVLRPTWLPARYDASIVTLEYVHDSSDGWRYRIGYHASGGGNLLLALGGVNSGPPTSTESVTVRGQTATLSASNSWPALQLFWKEGSLFYSVQSNDLTREELLHIGESLQAVP